MKPTGFKFAPALFFLLTAAAVISAASEAVVLPEVRSEDASFRLVRVAEGLENPWGLAFLPDGGMLVTERPGRLVLFRADGTRSEVRGLPRVADRGQGGLLDIVLDPDFGNNRRVYFSYSAPGTGGAGTAVARARLEGTELRDLRVIFEMAKKTGAGQHFGSRLAFAPDGTLFISTGDRGDRHRAQDLGDHAGKLLRINPDGSVPGDNPFAGRREALPEIYSYGHRNIQGIAVHPDTGLLWSHEHGPRGGDEINIAKPGANYGWPLVTYGREYVGGAIGEGTSKPGLEDPLLHWTPSIAPSGMAFYMGNRFPRWKGDLFVGALAGRQLRRVVFRGDGGVAKEELLLEGRIGRIRDVRQGSDGNLYLLTDERNGALYRIEPVR
jgi:glucose/arabinose dehydrogenase